MTHQAIIFFLQNPFRGDGYQFWSGIGSDAGEATIVLVLIHHINCSEKGCWRIGHPGRNHLCHRHHQISMNPPIQNVQ